jgi:hypothetical protein
MIPRSKSVIEIPAPGAAMGRLFSILDIGSQPLTWQGREREVRQIKFTFELPNCLATMGDRAGQPLTVSQKFTASIGAKAKLRPYLENWFAKKFPGDKEAGEFFDERLYTLLGMAGMINIVHSKDGNWANAESVTTIPAGLPKPAELKNPKVFGTLDPMFWDPTPAIISAFSPAQKTFFEKFGPMKKVYGSLSDWELKQITGTPEYQEVAAGVVRDTSSQADAPPSTDEDAPPF